MPYWLNGLIPLAAQLEHPDLLKVAQRYVGAILDRQSADGWVGPKNLSDPATLTPWPRYRLLTAMTLYLDVFPAERNRTLAAMHRLVGQIHRQLLHNISSESDMMYKFSWAHARWYEFVANAQFLVDQDPANTFGDRAELFAAMDRARAVGLDWDGWFQSRQCDNATDSACFPCRDAKSGRKCAVAAAEEYFCEHGVNVAQAIKVWAIEARNQTRAAEAAGPGADAEAALAALERLERCHGQPGSVLSAHEVIDGVEPDRGTETCHVVEAMYSYAELFAAFGDAEYLDRVEAAAFNRLPAPYLNGSMWALEYFHSTNTMGGCNVFGLPFECCVANGNQGWPKLTHHLFASGGVSRGIARLVAAIHAPANVSTALDDGTRVAVQVATEYPFGDTLTYTIHADASFEFAIRVPGWADGASVRVTNGNEHTAAGGHQRAHGGTTAAPRMPVPGTFYELRVAAGTTTVVATFPLRVRLEPSPAGYGGATVHAGPLLFALDLAPVEPKSTDCYFPPSGCYYGSLANSTPWRQALAIDRSAPGGAGGLKLELAADSGLPFASNAGRARIRAAVVGVAVDGWPTQNCTSMESGCHTCVGPVPTTPATKLTGAPRRSVSLVPFGSTDIRIAVLPVVDVNAPTFY